MNASSSKKVHPEPAEKRQSIAKSNEISRPNSLSPDPVSRAKTPIKTPRAKGAKGGIDNFVPLGNSWPPRPTVIQKEILYTELPSKIHQYGSLHRQNRPSRSHSFDCNNDDVNLSRGLPPISRGLEEVNRVAIENRNSISGQDLMDLISFQNKKNVEESRPSSPIVENEKSIENHHKPQRPSDSTEPSFKQFDTQISNLSDFANENPHLLTKTISPLVEKVKNGKFSNYEDRNGEDVALKAENIFDAYSQEAQKRLEILVPNLTIPQINVLLFHLARIGDTKSLETLAHNLWHTLNLNKTDDDKRTPLFYAAIANSPKAVNLLLKNGAMIDMIDSSGRTPLLWAAYYGNVDSTKQLLKSGANIHHLDFQGKSSLHCATFPENSRTLNLLIKKFRSEGLDLLDEEKMSPLMWAAYYGNPKNVKTLLSKSANPFLKDCDGKTALHWAAGNKHSGVCCVLLDHDHQLATVKDNLGRVALHLGAGEGNCSIVDILIKNKATKIGVRDEMRRTPLHWAAGHVSCTKLLCDRGANLNKTDKFGASALHYAAEKNFANCSHVLIKKGITVNLKDENGQTALIWCAISGQIEMIKLLLQAGSTVDLKDSQGMTALHYAAYHGHTSCCLLFIQEGADLREEDLNKHTPLFRACIGGWSETALALINEGADVHGQDINGRHPLNWASNGGHLDVIQILIGCRANPNCIDYKHTVPLYEAAFRGFEDVIIYLIDSGAYVNAKDDEGVTALHGAAGDGHVNACHALLTHGADLNCLDFVNRESPLDFCVKNSHAQYLKICGALSSHEIKEKSAFKIQSAWKQMMNRKKAQKLKNESRKSKHFKENLHHQLFTTKSVDQLNSSSMINLPAKTSRLEKHRSLSENPYKKIVSNSKTSLIIEDEKKVTKSNAFLLKEFEEKQSMWENDQKKLKEEKEKLKEDRERLEEERTIFESIKEKLYKDKLAFDQEVSKYYFDKSTVITNTPNIVDNIQIEATFVVPVVEEKLLSEDQKIAAQIIQRNWKRHRDSEKKLTKSANKSRRKKSLANQPNNNIIKQSNPNNQFEIENSIENHTAVDSDLMKSTRSYKKKSVHHKIPETAKSNDNISSIEKVRETEHQLKTKSEEIMVVANKPISSSGEEITLHVENSIIKSKGSEYHEENVKPILLNNSPTNEPEIAEPISLEETKKFVNATEITGNIRSKMEQTKKDESIIEKHIEEQKVVESLQNNDSNVLESLPSLLSTTIDANPKNETIKEEHPETTK